MPTNRGCASTLSAAPDPQSSDVKPLATALPRPNNMAHPHLRLCKLVFYSRMVVWSDLSHCHSGECKFHGSCRKFFPADGVPIELVEALGLVCVCGVAHVAATHSIASSSLLFTTPCRAAALRLRRRPAPLSSARVPPAPTRGYASSGCYGVQHFDSKPDSTTESSTPSFDTSAKSSASAPTKEKPQAPAGFFTESARLRQQRQMGQIHEVLDPSSKIHIESWARLAPRPDKRKARPKDEGPVKRTNTGNGGSAASLKPPVKFTLVLVEKPAGVYAETYRMRLRKEKRFSMYGFVLLSKKSVSRGARPYLVPHKAAGDFGLQDLEWSVLNHRQEKMFKRCIFISPSRWSPNLKLDIDDTDTGSSDSDADDEQSHPFVSKDPPMGSTEPDIGSYPTDDWLNEPDESPASSSSWTPAHVFDIAADELFPELKFIISFGEPGDADYAERVAEYFRLGPQGLQPFIDFLHRLYITTIEWTPKLLDADLAAFIAILDALATPIHSALLHFRVTVPRTKYDPRGFAELQEVLGKARHKFGEADASDRLVVLNLLVGRDGVEAFASSLEADFGSITAARSIRVSSLLLGPHGIDGFLNKVVIPLLDILPPSDPSYYSLHPLLGTFCGELATKMTNYTKAQGKKKFPDTTEKDGHAAGGAGYDTRSKKSAQGSQYNFSDIDERSDISQDTDSDTMSQGSSVYEFEPTDTDCQKFAKGDGKGPASDTDESEQEQRPSPRPKFPYPESRPQRECPYDKPAPSAPPPTQDSPRPKPRPKPRPTYKNSGASSSTAPPPYSQHTAASPEDPPTGAEHLAGLPTRRNLIQRILEDFPHPIPARRLSWDSVSERPSNRALYHQVVLVYHPDKNVDMPPDWQRRCDFITKTLNSKFN
ncbi:hypothetical protein B0H15DRAFT_958165 [Mycena belliarum]|uniref:J domain-containing protein n=1 Tax=Mycena belliarum TaxID=1033014 RepID=A0AAD6TNF7_9AGAR|nr:hypothetical protein B0H15DRAFT_958165 [Mycena belliae]